MVEIRFAMQWPLIAGGAFLAGGLSFVGTLLLIRLLARHGVVDKPNERSSHSRPVPRGGGIAVVGAIVIAVAVFSAMGDALPWGVLGAVVVLAGVSWLDDVRGLGPLPRLCIQILAAVGVVALAAWEGLVFQGLLPPLLDNAAAIVVLVYFTNIYNFMDGIDGITGVETFAVGLGLALVGAMTGEVPLLAVAAAAAAVGFLPFNWQPARIFLGDVGSIPLGFLLGWLLLATAAAGHWIAALILAAYYLADASVTLLRRLFRGERPWRAHREHYYQQAVQKGMSHAAVSGAVLVVDLALVGLAAASVSFPKFGLFALAGAVVLVALVLWYFRRRPAPSRIHAS